MGIGKVGYAPAETLHVYRDAMRDTEAEPEHCKRGSTRLRIKLVVSTEDRLIRFPEGEPRPFRMNARGSVPDLETFHDASTTPVGPRRQFQNRG